MMAKTRVKVREGQVLFAADLNDESAYLLSLRRRHDAGLHGWGIVSGQRAILGDYVEAINKLLRARLCANHPEQHAIRPALEGDQGHLLEMKAKLIRRRDMTAQMLNAIPGISCVVPEGAFYAFPRLNIAGPDDEFVQDLIRETGVVVVPGSGFGQQPGSRHFRVVFLPPDEILEKAYDQIGRFFSRYHAG